MAEASLEILIDIITKSAKQNVADLKQSVIGFNQAMELTKTVVNFAMNAIGKLGDAFGAPIRAAIEFESQLAEIQTLFGDASIDAQKLSKDLLGISSAFGMDKGTVAKAYYQAISSGAVDASTANDLLVTASKLAIGGVTDLATAVDGITNVLNGWNLNASEAAGISDVFFIAMQKGKTTVGELASELNKAAPNAAALGINFDELAAASAALTLTGTPTAVTFTQLKAVMANLQKPTDDLKKGFAAAGITSLETSLKADGLKGVLEKLAATTDGTVTGMSKLWSSTEAGGAFLALTGTQAKSFADILDTMRKAAQNAGETSAQAFDKIAQTSGFKLNQAKQQFENFITSIGQFLLPIAATVGEEISKIVSQLSKFLEDNRDAIKEFALSVVVSVKAAFVVLGDFFKLLIDNKDVLFSLAAGLASAAVAFGVLQVAMKGAAIAATVFNAASAMGGVKGVLLASVNPVFLVVAAIGALAAGVVWINQNLELFSYAVYQAKADILGALLPAIKTLLGFAEGANNALISLAQGVVIFFGEVPRKANEMAQKIGEVVLGIIDVITPLFDALGLGLGDALRKVSSTIAGSLQKIDSSVKGTTDSINDAFDVARKKVSDTSKGFVDGVEKMQKGAQKTANQLLALAGSADAAGSAQTNTSKTAAELAEEIEKLTKKGNANVEVTDEQKKAADEYAKKLKELGEEIKKLEFYAKNIDKAYQLIDGDAELARIAEVLGKEKAAQVALESLRLKSLKKIKEADMLRSKASAEAEIKAVQDVYRKREEEAKKAAEEQKKLDDANVKQSEENAFAMAKNYRLAFDSFAPSQAEVSKQTAEDVKAMEDAQKASVARMKAEWESYYKAIGAMGQGLTDAFTGVGSGIQSIASGDLFGGVRQSVESVMGGIKTAMSGVGELFSTQLSAGLEKVFGQEMAARLSGLGGLLGDALSGAARLWVSVMETGIELITTGLKTAFDVVSGAFAASFANSVKGILDSFENNIKAISEGTEAIVKFGKPDTAEAEKAIAEREKDEIAAIKERYKEEVDTARGAAGEISAEKKKELEAELKRIKTREDAEIKAAKKAAEESARALDDQKRMALAVKDLTAEQKAAITSSFADRKAQEKDALEQRIEAIRVSTEAEREAAKNRIAGINEEQKAAIKAIEAKRDAEIAAAKEAATASKADVGKEAASRNIFGDLATTIDEFVSAFVSRMPDIIDSFVDGAPKILESIISGIPKIVKTLVKKLPEILPVLTKAIPALISTIVLELPKIVQGIIDNLGPLIDALIPSLPKLVIGLIDAIIALADKFGPMIVKLVSTLIQAIISKIPEIIGSILRLIPFIIAEIPKIVQAIVDMLPYLIEQITQNLPAIILAIIDAIPDIIFAVIQAIPSIVWALIKGIIPMLGLIVGGIIERLITAVGKLGSWFGEIAGKIWTGIKEKAAQFWDWLKGIGSRIWSGVYEGVIKAWDWLKGIGARIWGGFWDGIVKAWEWFKNAGKSIWNGLGEGITKAWDWFKNIGRRIWDGLAEGFYRMTDWFADLFGFSSGGEIGNGPSLEQMRASGAHIGHIPISYARGGIVGGNAKFFGDNSANDTVPAMLSPGEIVIPRSAISGGFGEVMRFVADIMGKNVFANNRDASFASSYTKTAFPEARQNNEQKIDFSSLIDAFNSQDVVVQINGVEVARAVRFEVQKGFRIS
jgi:TP901 family phage tail tape measure protein